MEALAQGEALGEGLAEEEAVLDAPGVGDTEVVTQPDGDPVADTVDDEQEEALSEGDCERVALGDPVGEDEAEEQGVALWHALLEGEAVPQGVGAPDSV